jgi:hypothetical protein
MKIVLTGAPSSGKSSTLAELARQKRPDITTVPESAIVLLAGGYPAPAHEDLEQIRAFQQLILHVQASLEFTFARKNPNSKHFIFDRAELDGGGFWPKGPDDYFKMFNLDPAKLLNKYDAVIFMELPDPTAFGGTGKERFHDYEQSRASGKVLEKIWSGHSRFIRVPAAKKFEDKVRNTIAEIDKLISGVNSKG